MKVLLFALCLVAMAHAFARVRNKEDGSDQYLRQKVNDSCTRPRFSCKGHTGHRLFGGNATTTYNWDENEADSCNDDYIIASPDYNLTISGDSCTTTNKYITVGGYTINQRSTAYNYYVSFASFAEMEGTLKREVEDEEVEETKRIDTVVFDPITSPTTSTGTIIIPPTLSCDSGLTSMMREMTGAQGCALRAPGRHCNRYLSQNAKTGAYDKYRYCNSADTVFFCSSTSSSITVNGYNMYSMFGQYKIGTSPSYTYGKKYTFRGQYRFYSWTDGVTGLPTGANETIVGAVNKRGAQYTPSRTELGEKIETSSGNIYCWVLGTTDEITK